MPTRALGAIKHAIDHAAHANLDAQLDLERDLQSELGASYDYAEGVAAFLARRSPKFQGR
jgi:2-(1,2-epoxy-1,2-dihydrophenyl)acetyl-CoA isomerase